MQTDSLYATETQTSTEKQQQQQQRTHDNYLHQPNEANHLHPPLDDTVLTTPTYDSQQDSPLSDPQREEPHCVYCLRQEGDQLSNREFDSGYNAAEEDTQPLSQTHVEVTQTQRDSPLVCSLHHVDNRASSSSPVPSGSSSSSLPRLRVPLSSVVSHLNTKWSLEYLNEAEAGCVESMCLVAQMYLDGGWGALPEDAQQGKKWLERAKRQGGEGVAGMVNQLEKIYPTRKHSSHTQSNERHNNNGMASTTNNTLMPASVSSPKRISDVAISSRYQRGSDEDEGYYSGYGASPISSPAASTQPALSFFNTVARCAAPKGKIRQSASINSFPNQNGAPSPIHTQPVRTYSHSVLEQFPKPVVRSSVTSASPLSPFQSNNNNDIIRSLSCDITGLTIKQLHYGQENNEHQHDEHEHEHQQQQQQQQQADTSSTLGTNQGHHHSMHHHHECQIAAN